MANSKKSSVASSGDARETETRSSKKKGTSRSSQKKSTSRSSRKNNTTGSSQKKETDKDTGGTFGRDEFNDYSAMVAKKRQQSAKHRYPQGLIPEATMDVVHKENVHWRYAVQNLDICFVRLAEIKIKGLSLKAELKPLEAKAVADVVEENLKVSEVDKEIYMRIMNVENLFKEVFGRMDEIDRALEKLSRRKENHAWARERKGPLPAPKLQQTCALLDSAIHLISDSKHMMSIESPSGKKTHMDTNRRVNAFDKSLQEKTVATSGQLKSARETALTSTMPTIALRKQREKQAKQKSSSTLEPSGEKSSRQKSSKSKNEGISK